MIAVRGWRQFHRRFPLRREHGPVRGAMPAANVAEKSAPFVLRSIIISRSLKTWKIARTMNESTGVFKRLRRLGLDMAA
ncbi:MAG: hypothetical protein LBB47_05265 [Spirochaetaceae bacterium]|jgi:hypothetical protein|nr:hypothetical protein [Spirochaetaceae bacterium]